jgi:hypothetical protein
MPDRATWMQRVAEWRATGLSSPAFCKGRGYSASGLRYWASRLELEGEPPAAATVPLARVLRRRGRPPGGGPAGIRGEGAASAVSAAALVVECGRWRVVVRPGCDRATLGAVLDEVSARGGAR